MGAAGPLRAGAGSTGPIRVCRAGSLGGTRCVPGSHHTSHGPEAALPVSELSGRLSRVGLHGEPRVAQPGDSLRSCQAAGCGAVTNPLLGPSPVLREARPPPQVMAARALPGWHRLHRNAPSLTPSWARRMVASPRAQHACCVLLQHPGLTHKNLLASGFPGGTEVAVASGKGGWGSGTLFYSHSSPD